MTTFEQKLKDSLAHSYDIERELGGGGMSRVFVAVERSLGRKIVIKILSPDLTADVNRGRFRREIQVAAQLQHPHIVTLLSAGEIDDLLYYTMPFISGESLRSAVEKTGPLPVVEVVRVLYHVSEALDYAHGEGVVHRDIKPANILRSGSYSLITDFGVAKALNASMPASGMTSTGMAVGTPAYMAPEQLAGDSSADHRIDIYALGLLAYELLYGKSPFAASTPQRILAAVLTQDPTPLIEVRPDVPPSLSELVMQCLSKEPEKRPASATEVIHALDIFSTASGEIRTMERKIPRTPTPAANRVIPTPTTAQVPITGQVASPTGEVHASPNGEVQTTVADHPTGEAPYVGYDQPKKSRSGLIAGGIGILALAAVGGFFLMQRSGGGSSEAVAPPTTPLVTDSSSMQAAVPSVAVPESAVAAAPVIDSTAIKDSLRRVARRDSLRKAAAKADSIRKAHLATVANAKSAAQAMLSNAAALKSFTDGATHKGGLLGTKTKGDLQTQIDALTPFLSRAGVTYEQFKGIVAESGIKLFDADGRMVPDSLRRFVSQ